MKGRFQTYFRQTSHSLFNCWLENSSQPTMAGLHDLRVLFKKLKFCQHFLFRIHGKSALGKLPDQLRHLFKQAGVVRELQLLNEWLVEEGIDLEKELLCNESNIKHELNQLQRLLTEYQVQVGKGLKKAEQLANRTHPILSDQYWQELNSSLKKNLRKSRKKDWHEIRKQIKRWIYALNCLEELKSPSKSYVQSITQLEKNIGKWHECWMIRQHLEEKEPGDTDPLTFRTQFALAINRIEEQTDAAEKKTERQLKKVLDLL